MAWHDRVWSVGIWDAWGMQWFSDACWGGANVHRPCPAAMALICTGHALIPKQMHHLLKPSKIAWNRKQMVVFFSAAKQNPSCGHLTLGLEPLCTLPEAALQCSYKLPIIKIFIKCPPTHSCLYLVSIFLSKSPHWWWPTSIFPAKNCSGCFLPGGHLTQVFCNLPGALVQGSYKVPIMIFLNFPFVSCPNFS